MIGATKDDVRKCFENFDESGFDCSDDVTATTFPEVVCRINGKYGNLVVFRSKNDMRMGTIAHESFHVLSRMMDVMPLVREPNGTNEHLAYLMQWIASCINKARLGIGDFVEIKDKEE